MIKAAAIADGLYIYQMENPFEIISQQLIAIEQRLERIEQALKIGDQMASHDQQPTFVDINGAAEILGRSANAIRILLSAGKLVAIKQGGNRNYFEREYLEKWMRGEVE